MKPTKRILSLLLAAMLLNACSGGKTESETDGIAPGADTAADTAPVETEITVELPDKNYGGADVMFLTVQNAGLDQYSCYEIYTDEMNGTLINDAVFVRNGQVEKALGVRIAESKQPDAEKVARSNLVAGDTTFDVVMPYMNRAIDLATEGLLTDLSAVPYLALEKPWWDGRVTKDMVIADKVFFSTGDISILDNECTMVMFFNKDLITDYSLESPYELVREKRWTIDKVGELASAVTHDVDGDGKMTSKDAWGMTAAFNAPVSFYIASGERIVDRDADGNLQNAIGEALFEDTFSKILTLYTTPNLNANPNTLQAPDGYSAWKYYLRLPLAENRCLFNIATFATHSFLREEMEESTYGFLPCPKLSEAQDRYYTPVSYWNGTFIGIPLSASNLDFVGTVLNAMEYKSEDTIVPAFYNVALSYKYATDADSIRMLEIIRDGAVVDIGVAFNIGKIQDKLTENVQNGQNTFASSYASREKSVLKDIETIMDAVRYAQ